MLTSSLGGSVLGWVGAAVSRHQDGKQKLKELEIALRQSAQDQQHEIRMAEMSYSEQAAKLQAELNLQTVTLDYKGLEASIAADKATYSNGSTNKWLIFVDVVRGTMRPILTGTLLVYLMIALAYLIFGQDIRLSQEQNYGLLVQIITCLTTGANVSLAWWFGSRRSDKAGG